MGTLTVDVYKGPIKLGSATATDGGATATLTSYTGTALPKNKVVTVTVTQAGTHVGRTIRNRVSDVSGDTITLTRAMPFI